MGGGLAAGVEASASPLLRRITPHARIIERAADAAAIPVALLTALALRSLERDGDLDTLRAIAFGAGFVTIFGLIGWVEGLYRNRSRYGSFDEVRSLARTAAVTTVLAVAGNRLAEPELVPAMVAVLTGVLATGLMAAIRYLWRMWWESAHLPRGEGVERVLLIGAGEGGEQLVRAMRRNPSSPYLPVGFLDDDRGKQHLRISGVRVLGTTNDLARAATAAQATAAVVAIPSADAALVRELAGRIRAAGLDVLVLPPVGELLGHVSVSDVRAPTELDLLGRQEVTIDIDAIADYITGKRVLVTGAGGSIGSELCRQLQRFAPERVVMVDRDESGLHGTELLIHGRALLDGPDVVVADIRDRNRVFEIFEATRPHVVFHAAALKHLPLLEQHPDEAFKTNVVGTANVLDAAAKTGVGHFVTISTDKAADATSVLGKTKRLAERLTATAAATTDGVFLSVRFGNVLGSRGSVLTTFRRQIADGGPVTVTHPDVTRYFMTIEEAVQLVIQAGAIGSSGTALVLDMGEPVRIAALVDQLVASSTRPIDVVFTGLRPGEKLHERLHGIGESPTPTAHPMITSVAVPPLAPSDVVHTFSRAGTSVLMSAPSPAPTVRRAPADGRRERTAIDRTRHAPR